jgi:integrase
MKVETLGAIVETPVIDTRSLSSFIDDRTRARLKSIIDDGTPANTKAAYKSDMNYFWTWAAAINWVEEPTWPVPVDIVLRYVADHLEGLDPDVDEHLIACGVKTKKGPHAISTIDRRISALSTFHRMKGVANPCADPTVITLMSKSRKAAARRGYKPFKKKAIVKTVLDQIIETTNEGRLIDIRDRALILFGWASGGRRRSEIASAIVGNLEEVDGSFVYHMGITKTNQEGEDIPVPVTGRAASALREWLNVSGIIKGPLFRRIDRHGNIGDDFLNDRTVARIIKARTLKAGLDPRLFSGHSLRSGFLTEAGIQNVNLLEAMKMSLHKTVQVAAGYHQAGGILHNEAASMLGNGKEAA